MDQTLKQFFMSTSYIKCPECGTENVNRDYCGSCGAILNVVLQRNLKREKKMQAKIAARENEKPSRVAAFLDKGRTHSNFAVRSFFNIGYAIWFIVAAAVDIFIAVLVGAVAS